MCTAIGIKSNDNYFFGRTLDVCSGNGERTVITPRSFPVKFRAAETLKTHCAVIGTALVVGGAPLYYEAMNDCGLCMAGLNFPGNAVYHPVDGDKINLAPFEIILYILGKCKNLEEARAELKNVNIADISFSEALPHTPLHWMIGDASGEIVVESVEEGLKVYDNPAGVLTNNPTFEKQLFNLKNYAALSPYNPKTAFTDKLDLAPYSRGMGALGLPGDWSSPSRFVRAAFVKYNLKPEKNELSESDFFNLLESVKVPNGCVEGATGFQYTVYSCCCNTMDKSYTRRAYSGESVKSALTEENCSGSEIVICG